MWSEYKAQEHNYCLVTMATIMKVQQREEEVVVVGGWGVWGGGVTGCESIDDSGQNPQQPRHVHLWIALLFTFVRTHCSSFHPRHQRSRWPGYTRLSGLHSCRLYTTTLTSHKWHLGERISISKRAEHLKHTNTHTQRKSTVYRYCTYY